MRIGLLILIVAGLLTAGFLAGADYGSKTAKAAPAPPREELANGLDRHSFQMGARCAGLVMLKGQLSIFQGPDAAEKSLNELTERAEIEWATPLSKPAQ